MRSKVLLSSCVILPHFKHPLNVSRSSQNCHFPARGTKSCSSGKGGGFWKEKLDHRKGEKFQSVSSSLNPSLWGFSSALHIATDFPQQFKFGFISLQVPFLLCCDSMFDPQDSHKSLKQQIPHILPEIPWVSCHNLPPAWPEDQRYFGIDKHLRIWAGHAGVPHPPQVFPSPPGLQMDFPGN